MSSMVSAKNGSTEEKQSYTYHPCQRLSLKPLHNQINSYPWFTLENTFSLIVLRSLLLLFIYFYRISKQLSFSNKLFCRLRIADISSSLNTKTRNKQVLTIRDDQATKTECGLNTFKLILNKLRLNRPMNNF